MVRGRHRGTCPYTTVASRGTGILPVDRRDARPTKKHTGTEAGATKAGTVAANTTPNLVLHGVNTVTDSCTVADAVRGTYAQIDGDLQ
jgi:hypothetical protein